MWAQLVSIPLGVWLMLAPAVLGYDGAMRVSDRVVGPVIASFAWIAVGQCTREVRWAKLPFGLWLVLAPLVLSSPPDAALSSVLTGVAVAFLSFVEGRRSISFGGGWSVLWKKNACGTLDPETA